MKEKPPKIQIGPKIPENQDEKDAFFKEMEGRIQSYLKTLGVEPCTLE
jgi:hypothetical protein